MEDVIRDLENALGNHPVLKEAELLIRSFRLYLQQDLIPLKAKAKKDYLRRIERFMERIYSLGEL
jgi:hypothetical protein